MIEPAEILAAAKRYEQDTVRFLCDMVRVPSFSCEEGDVVRVIKAGMEKAGFDEARVDGLGNVIGRVGSGPRIIAFDAHVDTVMEGARSQWKRDPFGPVVEDGRVWGRGTVDQEGGMASMVCAGRIIKDLGLAGDLAVLFTGTVMEEDCDGLCWQYIIREGGIRPEVVVITEPTNMNIYRGHRGRMEMKVRLSGVSCHGSAPERGVNAVYRASRVALEIEKLNGRLRTDPFLGKATVAVTECGSSSPSLCAVPDGAVLHLDRRMVRGETRESAIAEVLEAARSAGVGDAAVEVPVYEEVSHTDLVYPMEKYYPTWVLEEDSPHLARAVSVYRDLFGKDPMVDKWTFSTNGVAIMGMHGIPCLGLGPGNEVLAHAPNEACPVEHLTHAAAFYAAFAARMAGTA